MSKSNSGHFYGTSGSFFEGRSSDTRIKTHSYIRVKSWAEKKCGELIGKEKKSFNTACVVYDESTGKYYYGRNGGYREVGYMKNPKLFGDSRHQGLLPKTSLNKYPVGNCAEVDAVNRALNDGAKLKNLHMTTIHATKSQFGTYKRSCENCRYALYGRIKSNYSGWKEGDQDE